MGITVFKVYLKESGINVTVIVELYLIQAHLSTAMQLCLRRLRSTRCPSDGDIKEFCADASCEGATKRYISSAMMYEAVLMGNERLFPAHLALPSLLAYFNRWMKNLLGKTCRSPVTNQKTHAASPPLGQAEVTKKHFSPWQKPPSSW